jgi:cytoskeletal protein CcmA (bactofilin family)
MSQLIINTGNVFNDGTGDPLRVAFNAVNNNFSQIWSAGLVGSNISIANNTIQVTNTNGNLNLATNGVGVIVPKAAIVPDFANIRSIGTATNRFNTVYTQYLNATGLNLSGNLYVAGNLQVVGNTVTNNYSNANIANLTIILASGSSNAVLANNAGIIVNSANANLLYNNSANSWVSTIAISAPTFKGDGANLTNVNANVNANSLLGNTLRSTILYSNLTSVGTLTGLTATGDISTTGNVYANVYTGNIVTANVLVGDGGNISNINAAVIVGNVTSAINARNSLTANLAALATQSINANTALFAINAGIASTANTATSALTANTASYSVQSDNANSAVVAGLALELSPTATLSITGNITTGAYFIGDGSQLANLPAGNYSNANVAAYLPTFSGNINNLTFSPDLITGPTNGNGYPYLKLTPGDTRVGDDAGNISLWSQGNIYNFGGDGVLTLPTGHSYVYDATLTGYGSGTAQIHFELLCDLSGTITEWISDITTPGTGYSVGQEFTYDSTFLRIPNASLTILVASIDGSGGITNIDVTEAPLYPPSFYQSNSFIALEANDSRWTFGLNGNLTLPANLYGVATAVSIDFAGVGYTTATDVPTNALTGYGSGMTVDIVASSSGSNPITSVTINQPGMGYATGDSIQVAQPSSTGNGTLNVDAVTAFVPSINYGNGQPYGGSSGPVGPNISVTGNIIADGSISANTILVGGTPFTRTLLVGTDTTPVNIPLASNNSFNVLTADGSSNVVVYTT